MSRRWALWVLLLGLGGCCGSAQVAPRAPVSSVAPVSLDLPFTPPAIPSLDGKNLPGVPARSVAGPEGKTFRRLTETDCLRLAAAGATAANVLDEENRRPNGESNCSPQTTELRRMVRYYTALELRNRAAAEALERYFMMADVEARTDLLRKGVPIIEPLLKKSIEAKAAGQRFPLETADLEVQKSQLLAQLDQAELGSRLIDLDLKRRLGFPQEPADERLWPAGEFAIDPAAVDPDAAVTAALADRPELRGLRELRDGLTPEVIEESTASLQSGRLALCKRVAGRAAAAMSRWLLGHDPKPSAATLAELELRRTQLTDLIAERERAIADEARAAALMVNAQLQRAARARERLLILEEKLAEAVKKREANQPGAEFLEPQVRLEWLKAKGELAAEVAAWHLARVRYRAALGWLAWEALGGEAAPGSEPPP